MHYKKKIGNIKSVLHVNSDNFNDCEIGKSIDTKTQNKYHTVRTIQTSEAKSKHIANKYMTADFPFLVHAIQLKVAGLS